MIHITEAIVLDEGEIHEEFVRCPGPGGQNVNKVATAVQLRFDVRHCPSLPEEVRQRLMALAGRRLNAEGVLIINARRFRTQERNRQDARERLIELVRRAAVARKARRRTGLPLAEKRRRLDRKRRHGQVKRLRAPVAPDESG